MLNTIPRLAISIFFALFLSVSPSVSSSVFAQHEEMKVDNAQRSKKDEVLTALRGGGALSQPVNTYLSTYFFPRWTHAANSVELLNFRNRDLPELLGAATGQAKTELLERCKTLLAYMASNKKNYYLACRYNAMYALGTLDQEDGPPPVPYAGALPELLKAYEDKSYPDGVRLSALEGLLRHATLGVADEQIRDEQIVSLFSQIALDTPYHPKKEPDPNVEAPLEVYEEQQSGTSQTSEPQRSADIQDWFRMRAIQALGSIKDTKVAGKIAATLLKVIENKVENPVIRYEAAFALSQLPLKADEINLTRTTKALVELGIDVCDDSLLFMEEQLRLQQVQSSSGASAMGGGGGMGMPSGDGGMPSMSSRSMSPGMGGGGMPGAGGTSTMSEAQITQINNSIQRVKYGFSSIVACINGPTYKGAEGLLRLADKDKITVATLENVVQTIADCIKFLDDGDPEAAKKAATARRTGNNRASMEGSEMMMGGGGPRGGGAQGNSRNAKTAPSNEPKVSMREIEEQLKKAKGKFRVLIDSPTSEPVVPAG